MTNFDNLKGGYGVTYNPGPALTQLSEDRESAIEELWENLYHQGDVGLASYAAVPALVASGELSIVAAIEVARHSKHNPALPETMEDEYYSSVEAALASVPEDEENLRGYYILHATKHGQLRLAKALQLMDIDEVLETYGGST